MISVCSKFLLWSVLLVMSCSSGYCAVPEAKAHSPLLPLDINIPDDLKGTKIVGGYPAAEGEVPWQVGLLANDGTSLFCGGTLISSDVVLSAAHCFVIGGEVFQDFQVGYGGLNQPDLPIKSAVKAVLPHKEYSQSTSDNDIALVILEDPVENFTDLIFPADLPLNITEDYTTEEVTASGWGTLFSGGSTTRQLQAVQVEVWSNEDCADVYAITENMMCAGVEDFSKDACQGDSGGPLVKIINETSEIVGITSWGKGCAEQGYPGVYTRVTKYIDWIVETACAAGSCLDGDNVTEEPYTTDDAAANVNHLTLLIIQSCLAAVLYVTQ